MRSVVEFRFGIKKTVLIKESGLVGTVCGLFYNEQQQRQACVRYADKVGVIHETWMNEEALAAHPA